MTQTADRLAEPVALLHTHPEHFSELEMYRYGAGCLTEADRKYGWTETRLYEEPVLQSLSTDLDKAQQEVARLHTLAKANNDLARHEANGRRALQEEIERLREALLDARAFIDGDSPDWRYAKQDQLASIDAALNPQPGKESGHD